jgi:hypothetical protein
MHYPEGRSISAAPEYQRSVALIEIYSNLRRLRTSGWVARIVLGDLACRLFRARTRAFHFFTRPDLAKLVTDAAAAARPGGDEPNYDRALLSFATRDRTPITPKERTALRALRGKYRAAAFDYAADRRMRDAVDRLLAR